MRRPAFGPGAQRGQKIQKARNMKRLRSSPPQERHFSVIFTRQPVMDAAGLPGTDRPGALQAIRTIPLIMTVMTLWTIKQLGRC